jgi:DHA1 family bicyclomycin/chloramphenicol resistance-like MFS transporter
MPAPRTDRPPRRIAFLIAGFGMFGPFSIDAIFPGFPLIAKDLAASPVMMQQIISVYLVGFGLMSLFHGPLSDALGRRKVVLWSTVVFVLAISEPYSSMYRRRQDSSSIFCISRATNSIGCLCLR